MSETRRTGAAPKDDPIIEARVQHAMEPWEGLLPEEYMDLLRDYARNFMTTHPVGSRLVARLRPPPDQSGERPTQRAREAAGFEGDAASPDDAARDPSREGKPRAGGVR